MPDETISPSMSQGHRAQSIRVGIEVGIAVLTGLIAWNANRITNQLDKVIDRVGILEQLAAGNRHQIDAINKRLDGFSRINEIQWGEIRALREEFRQPYSPRR